jgi:hypothetical protein
MSEKQFLGFCFAIRSIGFLSQMAQNASCENRAWYNGIGALIFAGCLLVSAVMLARLWQLFIQ